MDKSRLGGVKLLWEKGFRGAYILPSDGFMGCQEVVISFFTLHIFGPPKAPPRPPTPRPLYRGVPHGVTLIPYVVGTADTDDQLGNGKRWLEFFDIVNRATFREDGVSVSR